MRLLLDRDWKLRNEHGDVVGSVEGSLTVVIDTRVGGTAKGERGTGRGFLSEDGLPPAHEQSAIHEDGQVALALPPSLVAREEPKFDAAFAVWEHYCQVMAPRNCGLDKDTRTIINGALKVATIDECKRAINACFASDYHMKRPGSGNDRRRYNQISQILKGKRGTATTRERIDFFLDLAEKSGPKSGVPSADAGRIRAAKQDVRDAYEMPGDDHVVQRGKASEEYLAEHGWRIVLDDTGWPTFHEPTS